MGTERRRKLPWRQSAFRTWQGPRFPHHVALSAEAITLEGATSISLCQGELDSGPRGRFRNRSLSVVRRRGIIARVQMQVSNPDPAGSRNHDFSNTPGHHHLPRCPRPRPAIGGWRGGTSWWLLVCVCLWVFMMPRRTFPKV